MCAETDWYIMLWDDVCRCEAISTMRHMLVSQGAKPVQVSNALRYMCVYLYGGIYLDFDIIPIRLPEFEDESRMNLFTEVSWDTAQEHSTGEKKIAPNGAYFAAPPNNPSVLQCFWTTVQQTTFNTKLLANRLKGGVGVFNLLPQSFYDEVVLRGVNHFAPVNWAQARVLNMVEKYTYEQWLTLAESFVQYPDVYGVHTFDSSWVLEFNENRFNERNPDNEHNQRESAM